MDGLTCSTITRLCSLMRSVVAEVAILWVMLDERLSGDNQFADALFRCRFKRC